jgi:two-component system, LytTR family, sensor kinase
MNNALHQSFRQPNRTDWLLMAIFWTMALPFMVAGNLGRPWWFIGLGWALDIVTHTSPTLFIVYVLFPAFLFTRRYWLLLFSMMGTMLLFGLIDKAAIRLMYHVQEPFRWFGILNTVANMAPQIGFLVAVLTGKQVFETQQRLLRTEKERTEAELRHLKAQIDPHFLFNNLNVLDALIQRNPAEASAYLHRFAALYRYLIRHKDDDVVPLADELAFVNDYIYLIRQRFGQAYEVLTHQHLTDALAVFVLPGSIQTLIENAVKHNGGSETDPLLIELTVTDQTVTVSHERRPKLTAVEATGTGLKNLQTRYRLLSDREVIIQASPGAFVVTLPVLKQEKAIFI